MDGDTPMRPFLEVVQEVMRPAETTLFSDGPRGRFLRAVLRLERCHIEEATTARRIYSRTFANERAPLNTEAVGRAIRVLITVDQDEARDAIAALADLLAPPLAGPEAA